MPVALPAPRRVLASAAGRLRRWRHAALPVMIELLSPRGRCNRKAFLNIALVFLALQTSVGIALWGLGIEMSLPATLAYNAPILWIGAMVAIKRLHDVGRRAWWIPAAFTLWFVVAMIVSVVVSMVVGEEALEVGRPAFYAMFVLIVVPALGGLLWLHTAPGDKGPNRFGPEAGRIGLSRPSRTRRSSYLASAALMAA